MFTGIIKELGAVRSFNKAGAAYRLEIGSHDVVNSAGIGDSVAVNGICLTVVNKTKGSIYFDVMEETVKRSGLGSLRKSDVVNLEGALRFDGTLGGHFVLGHIDCIGKIKSARKLGDDFIIEVEFPGEFSHLIVEKGSIAIDGVSLTVARVKDRSFVVYIIPLTLKMTTLGQKTAGDIVNLEFDVIGKYIARFGQVKNRSSVTEEFLRQNGF